MKYLWILLLFACKPDPETGRVTFYQLNHTTYTNLYVDGSKRTDLYKTNQMPVCGDEVKWYVVTMELSIGSHTCNLGDANGNKTPDHIFVVSEECRQVKIP